MASHRSDQGETLIEIAIAITVLAIGIVALINALGTHVLTTVANKNQAQANAILGSAAEYVKGLPNSGGSALTDACTPTTAQAITTQVPHDSAVTVTYGPGQAINGVTPCRKLTVVPVTVDGPFHLTVNVVRRAP